MRFEMYNGFILHQEQICIDHLMTASKSNYNAITFERPMKLIRQITLFDPYYYTLFLDYIGGISDDLVLREFEKFMEIAKRPEYEVAYAHAPRSFF